MVDIYPPDSKPYGESYEEHIVKDWKRNLSTPIDKNPMEDKTGEWTNFGVGSNSPVLYLSGNTGGSTERNYKTRSGIGLFISIGDACYSDAEKPGSTIEELHQLAKKDQDTTNDVYLKINDEEFKYDDLKKYRFHTDQFDVTIPAQNAILGLRGGQTKAVVDGYYVITSPLTKGNYTIITKANVKDPSWDSQVKYNLVLE